MNIFNNLRLDDNDFELWERVQVKQVIVIEVSSSLVDTSISL